MNPPDDVTALLHDVRTGSLAAEARLLEIVYPRLRQIARNYLRAERSGHTLQPTALVNEAYLQFAGRLDQDWRDRRHFYGVAARSMRRILVDYARRKKAAKRDGRRQQVEFTDTLAVSDGRLDDIVAIDEALEWLAQSDARRRRVVEMRFFNGMTEDEVADVLRVTPRTVKRDWSAARAWLHGRLSGSRTVPSSSDGLRTSAGE